MTTQPDRYTVRLSARAVKDLRALPEKITTAAFEFIDTVIAVNPQRVGKPLRSPFDGGHSARRGDYRIMYRIDPDQHSIEVERINRRADIYRP